MAGVRLGVLASVILAAVSTADCASQPRQFALRDPVWTDPDTRPLHHRPSEYWSPLIWDGADQMVFGPIVRALRVDTEHEARNVNALDEVPDSSWYQNRFATRVLTPQEVFDGACAGAPEPVGTWTLIGSKPNGWFPGFLAIGPDGHRYLMKADGTVQAEQTSAGDIVGSRIFWAAGFNAPCDRSIRVVPAMLHIRPGAHYRDEVGDEHPITQTQIDSLFAHARHYDDGTYRLGISRFIDGTPAGPFQYEGTRRDDPNDVVPHEDRRDLRGAKLLSAWINHWDAREQNTLTTWIDTGAGTGYLRHYFLDFGDSLGSVWPADGLSRRLGTSGYFYADHVVVDLLSLGLVDRPWDHARVDPEAWIFGYYNEAGFDPEEWRPAYGNPAFARMTERDAAWMARIVARFDDDDIHAIVRAANLSYAPWATALDRILRVRRDRIVARYLTRLSSLADVAIEGERLCASDRAIEAHLYSRAHYRAEVLRDDDDRVGLPLGEFWNDGSRVCVPLPPPPSDSGASYAIVRIATITDDNHSPSPLAVHVYGFSAAPRYVVAGIVR